MACLALDQKWALISQNQPYCKKKGAKQGDTLHQPHGSAITVRMRTALSPGKVSGNHRWLFRYFCVTVLVIVIAWRFAHSLLALYI